jgi:hypothetical protein
MPTHPERRWHRLIRWSGTASALRHVHGWLTLLWLLLAIPAVMWWRYSVPFLVFVSVYANVTGHWAAWQAARAEEEVASDEADEISEEHQLFSPAVADARSARH